MNSRYNEDIESSAELTPPRQQGYFDKSGWLRVIIGVFFTLSLFVFLHFREIRVEILELDSPAERYVVSQVDFEFFDEEATAILRQEAVRDIGDINKINEKEIRQWRTDFEKFLIQDVDWRKRAEHSTFEEMYKGVDLLEEAMMRIRFTNSRTLHKMREVNVPIPNYAILTPPKDIKEIVLPNEVWGQITQMAFEEEPFNLGTTDFILDYFKEHSWILEKDVMAWRSLRNRVESQVPRKYTKVGAGDRIIDQGEIVISRHMAMMQAMKKALSTSRSLWHPSTLFGSLALALLFVAIGIAFLINYYPDILRSNRKVFLLITILLLAIILSKVTEFFLIRTTTKWVDLVRLPLLVPFPAILLCSLMRSGIATFASTFLAVILAMTLAIPHQNFMVVNLVAALVAILNTRSLRRRKEVFVICGKAWLASIVVVFSFHLYNNSVWTAPTLADLFTTLLFMGVTAILVVGLLPILESAFKIMTDVTLMEYMDPNHHLLRRLAIEAPGTYQHSVVVGNIAEAAAVGIGASGLFCRVATLYHDIGKLATPHYFTENQQGGVNIHQLLTPVESAQVIIAHVSEGVTMARKEGLPEQFIDVIKEHHGTTLVYFFYSKQLELSGGDKSKVDEKDFRYMGPKPRSKESAIIMIADSLEAASRSLDEVNLETVTELVDTIVREKAKDGQFDQCLLTFEELGIVKQVMVKTLVAVGHSRVKYPKAKDAGTRQAEESKAG